jgi:hypothetical protein
MKKRGQLTLFVIIGIILIVFIIGIIFLATNNVFSPSKSPEELKVLEENIENCIEDQAIKGLWLIGMQGGYITTPPDFIETPFSNLAYGLKGTKEVLLSNSKIEQELSDHVALALPYCFNKKDYTYSFEISEPNVESRIESNYVRIVADMPIYATSNETEYKLNKKYNIDISIKLGNILNLANDIIKRQKQEGDYIPVSFLANFETEVFFEYHDDDTIYYIIHDEESKLNNVTYNFLFAADLSPKDE